MIDWDPIKKEMVHYPPKKDDWLVKQPNKVKADWEAMLEWIKCEGRPRKKDDT
jgi:hypothetical protein